MEQQMKADLVYIYICVCVEISQTCYEIISEDFFCYI